MRRQTTLLNRAQMTASPRGRRPTGSVRWTTNKRTCTFKKSASLRADPHLHREHRKTVARWLHPTHEGFCLHMFDLTTSAAASLSTFMIFLQSHLPALVARRRMLEHEARRR
jgi:hypothetical protein